MSEVHAKTNNEITTPIAAEIIPAPEGAHDAHAEGGADHHSPMAQFEIKKLSELKVGGTDLSYTNSALWVTIAFLVSAIIFSLSTRRKSLVPNKMQAFGEVIYKFTIDMLRKNTNGKGQKFFPFIFTVFVFVLSCNLLGMLPYSFTVTSHLIVTFAIAIMIFGICVVTSIAKHGWHFFSIFVPSGTPTVMVPLMFFIEFFAYLARPISLSVRLFANMLAGHTMLKVIGGFVLPMGFLGGWLPLLLLSVLTGFEFFVALLQGYIFALLSCIYIGDALSDAH